MDFVNANTMEENEKIYRSAFFNSTSAKQAKGKEWWRCIHPDTPSYLENGEDGYLGVEGTGKQVEAVVKWVSGRSTDGTHVREEEESYERLGEVKAEVLVLAEREDEVVPVANSLVLWRKIRQARLWIGEEVGHGV
jgi:pimeloyl-ACP methyl ester carboxylesterase